MDVCTRLQRFPAQGIGFLPPPVGQVPKLQSRAIGFT